MRDRWPAATACALGAVVAVAVATGHAMAAVVFAAAPLAALAATSLLALLSRTPAAERLVGIVCVLLFASTFVWRMRTTQQLNSNPLDAAALVRVTFVAAAALLALAVLLSYRFVLRGFPAPLGFVGAYVVVAALAAIGSPLPLQALYRAFELGTGMLLFLVSLALLGRRAGLIVLRLVMVTISVIVAVIWVEALVLPMRAWQPAQSILPYELQGPLPAFASNTVGALGALLAIWGLARPTLQSGGHRLADLALVVGVATLLASQYRTGIIGFLAAGGVVAWHRRRAVFVVMVAATVLAVMLVGFGRARVQVETTFAKGRPELVSTLDSRTIYWRAAVPAIRERPILGWGLNVGSRRVLVSLGDSSISTIHGTWVEALLGTGIVGTSLLAAAFATALRQAWRARRHPAGIAIAGMLAFLAVRSITGSTVELFDLLFLVFGALAFAATQLADVPPVQKGIS